MQMERYLDYNKKMVLKEDNEKVKRFFLPGSLAVKHIFRIWTDPWPFFFTERSVTMQQLGTLQVTLGISRQSVSKNYDSALVSTWWVMFGGFGFVKLKFRGKELK